METVSPEMSHVPSPRETERYKQADRIFRMCIHIVPIWLVSLWTTHHLGFCTVYTFNGWLISLLISHHFVDFPSSLLLIDFHIAFLFCDIHLPSQGLLSLSPFPHTCQYPFFMAWILRTKIVHEYGKFLARNPGSFYRKHLVAISSLF